MASEWVTLARRLGFHRELETDVKPFKLMDSIYDDQRIQSLLVGETLRVARVLERKMRPRTPMMSMFTRAAIAEGDARATACLALLDAVGWKGETE